MAERLLDLVVTRAEHHLSCAVLWAQTLGNDCSAAFPLILCLPGGTAWFPGLSTPLGTRTRVLRGQISTGHAGTSHCPAPSVPGNCATLCVAAGARETQPHG